jgi:Uma2 family endonuclease
MNLKVPPPVIYPSSDGEPMAETDLHRDWMIWVIERLKWFFREKEVYVSGNLLIYFVEGNPHYCFAPDAFVVKDCKPGRREVFKIWEEKRVPSFVLETTSRSTRREDLYWKPQRYAELGIKEYFLYDPRGEWLDPPLVGYRLGESYYAELPRKKDGSIVSRELGIRFQVIDGKLEMFDARSGERLLSDGERAEEAQRRLAEEVVARQTLEEELARLRSRRKKS